MKSLTPEQAKQYLGTKTLMKFWNDEDFFVVAKLFSINTSAEGLHWFAPDAEICEYNGNDYVFRNCAVYEPECDCKDELIRELSYLASQFSTLKHGTKKHEKLKSRLAKILDPECEVGKHE